MSNSSRPTLHEQWEVIATTMMGMACGLYFQASTDAEKMAPATLESRPELLEIAELAAEAMEVLDELFDAIVRDKRDAAPPADGRGSSRMYK